MPDTDFSREKSLFIHFANTQSIGETAKEFGLPIPTARRMVLSLAWQLQVMVGVIGMEEDQIPTLDQLKVHKAGYMEALEHYVPIGVAAKLSAQDPGQQLLRDHIEAIREHSRTPARDVAMLLTLFTTATKPIEIARMEVRDYLGSDGRARRESILRAEISANAAARPLYFCSMSAVNALDAYLEERLAMGYGVTRSTAYRGLDPASGLFLTREGLRFRVRNVTSDNKRQLLCREIHDVYRRILRYGGHSIPCTSCARRNAAQTLWGRGTPVPDIAQFLGLRPNAVKKLLRSPQYSHPFS